MALKNYAIIENGIVVNIAAWDANMADEWVQSDTASIGDSWDGKVFTKPVLPEPPKPDPTAKDILEALIAKGIIAESDLKQEK